MRSFGVLSLVLGYFSLLGSTVWGAGSLPVLRQACLVVNRGVESFSCSGTLIGPNLVVTAQHCISEDGQTSVGCGVLTAIPGIVGYTFEENFKVTAAYVGPSEQDIAILRLDHPARNIQPLPVLPNYEVFLNSMTVQSPTVDYERILAPDVECRFSGFGIDPVRKRTWFSTTDESPRSGLVAYVADGMLNVQGWGESLGQHDHGDSGGSFYCRMSGASWLLVAVLSRGDLSRKSWNIYELTSTRQFASLLFRAQNSK